MVFSTGAGEMEADYRRFSSHTQVFRDFTHGPLSPAHLRRPRQLMEWSRSLVAAVRAARRLGPDVIYANSTIALPWALLSAGRRSARLVCHIHTYSQVPVGRQIQWWSRRVDAYICGSKSIRDEWIGHGLPGEHVHVVPFGVDPGDYPPASPEARLAARTALGLAPHAYVVAFLGRVVEDKGVEVLLRAWAMLRLPAAEASLVIVGPGRFDYIERLAAASEARFYGMRKDVLTPLHAADVVVVPSLWEPFGRVVIEAMAAGCPVIGSDTGGIRETLTGRFAQGLFEVGNAQDLADRLRAMRGWQTSEPDLGEACVSHILDHYSLHASVDGIEKVLSDG
jgi:glycosyltransferase involved in cell wall biosynthesis